MMRYLVACNGVAFLNLSESSRDVPESLKLVETMRFNSASATAFRMLIVVAAVALSVGLARVARAQCAPR